MDTPWTGLLRTLKCMADIPYVDLEYCPLSKWGCHKPTRFWGGPHVMEVESGVYDRETCQNMVGDLGTGSIGSGLGATGCESAGI